MEQIITKQQAVLNGNEAYLIGVDKIGQQIWLEVLNHTDIKCEISFPKENLNLNTLLTKKVFDITNGLYLGALLNHHAIVQKFLEKHPEESECKIVMKNLVKDILAVVKPTD
jgi:hypothetical protein